MVLYIAISVILLYVVLRSGQTIDGGWRFAPLRAMGMLLGGGFRVVGFIALLVFAVAIGVLGGTVRSTF